MSRGPLWDDFVRWIKQRYESGLHLVKNIFSLARHPDNVTVLTFSLHRLCLRVTACVDACNLYHIP